MVENNVDNSPLCSTGLSGNSESSRCQFHQHFTIMCYFLTRYMEVRHYLLSMFGLPKISFTIRVFEIFSLIKKLFVKCSWNWLIDIESRRLKKFDPTLFTWKAMLVVENRLFLNFLKVWFKRGQNRLKISNVLNLLNLQLCHIFDFGKSMTHSVSTSHPHPLSLSLSLSLALSLSLSFFLFLFKFCSKNSKFITSI